jgi:Polyketide cyclase / dehydrase and lipid transport
MFTTLALIVAVALVAALVFAALKPDTFRIERSIRIDVAPEVIFSNINDFKKWEDWSPWDKIDPALERRYSGAARGVGAAYAWTGNKKVGSGRMEIIGSTPFTGVQIKLDFTAPFVAHNIVDLTLTKDGDATHVSWAMSGPQPFISKVMGLAFNMDQIVGKDFTKGLAALKQVSEGTGYTKLMR